MLELAILVCLVPLKQLAQDVIWAIFFCVMKKGLSLAGVLHVLDILHFFCVYGDWFAFDWRVPGKIEKVLRVDDHKEKQADQTCVWKSWSVAPWLV